MGSGWLGLWGGELWAEFLKVVNSLFTTPNHAHINPRWEFTLHSRTLCLPRGPDSSLMQYLPTSLQWNCLAQHDTIFPSRHSHHPNSIAVICLFSTQTISAMLTELHYTWWNGEAIYVV